MEADSSSVASLTLPINMVSNLGRTETLSVPLREPQISQQFVISNTRESYGYENFVFAFLVIEQVLLWLVRISAACRCKERMVGYIVTVRTDKLLSHFFL